MNEITEYAGKIFENIKHVDKDGNEYWLARELMPLLEYEKWENFNNVIKKSITSYKNSSNDFSYWPPEIRKPITSGKGKKEFILDYKLTRYLCYLIVQNANPKKRWFLFLLFRLAVYCRSILRKKEVKKIVRCEF